METTNLIAFLQKLHVPSSRPRRLTTAGIALVVLSMAQTAVASGVVSACTEQDLRAALQGGGNVTFACDGTINLSVSVQINNNTVLDGAGRSILIDGMNAVRLFAVSTGVTFTVRNLTLARGAAPAGAGILNRGGMLALENVSFLTNVASKQLSYEFILASGGAVWSQGGAVTASNCVFNGNLAFGEPVSSSIFPSYRRTEGFGGAIYMETGHAKIFECLFTGNRAEGFDGGLSGPGGPPGYAGLGGAIFAGSQVELDIEGTRFFRNIAKGGKGQPGGGGFSAGSVGSGGFGGTALGGAIYSAHWLRARRCSFEGNQAIGGNGGAGGQGFSTSGGGGGSGGRASGGAVHATSAVEAWQLSCVDNSIRGGAGGVGGLGEGNAVTHENGRGGNGGDGGDTQGGALALLSSFAGVSNSTFAGGFLSSGTGGAGGDAKPCPGITPPERGGHGGNGGRGGDCFGGGVFLAGTNVQLASLTIASNLSVAGLGGARGLAGGCATGGVTNGVGGRDGDIVGGAIATGSSGNVRLVNTVLGYNTGALNLGGDVVDGGFNLSADGTPSPAVGSTRTNTDPSLGPLDASGFMKFFPLLPNSMAINSGSCAESPATDQNGTIRPVGAVCDIGAVEYNSSIRPMAIGVQFGSSVVVTGVPVRLRVTMGHANPFPVAEVECFIKLPPGLAVAPNPRVLMPCNSGSVSATPGDHQVSISQIHLSGQGYCTLEIDIISDFPGDHFIQGATLMSPSLGTRYATTLPAIRSTTLPTTTTLEATNLAISSITLGGRINPNGARTWVAFEWGTTPQLGQTTTAVEVGYGFDPVILAVSLTDLLPDQVYHYRAVASNSVGVSTGAIRSAATLGGNIPDCREETLRATLAASVSEIRFTCDGVIVLSSSLTVQRDTVIDGNGHSIVMSGNSSSRLFHVLPGVRLSLRNLSLNDGFSTNGGAIFNDGGTLSLLNCTFSNNVVRGQTPLHGTNGISPGQNGSDGSPGVAAGGGAIFNTGILRASNCVFLANAAFGGNGGDGGAGVDGQSFIDARGRCVFGTPGGNGGHGGSGAGADGGAIWNREEAWLENALFVQNFANAGIGGSGGAGAYGGCSAPGGGNGGRGGGGGDSQGGALHNAGLLWISGATFAFNQSSGGKGGFGGRPSGFGGTPGLGGQGGSASGGSFHNSGTSGLINVTIAMNATQGGAGEQSGPTFSNCSYARSADGGQASGGALANRGELALTNCTIWQNSSIGGGSTNLCYPSQSGAPGPSLASSISTSTNALTVAANSILGHPSAQSNIFGMILDVGNNFLPDNSVALTASGSRNNTDPLLGFLNMNGGFAPTLVPLPGSPAIDGGSDVSCPATDQRGVLRSFGWHCDVGAVEVVPDFFRIASVAPGVIQTVLRGIGIPGRAFRVETSSSLDGWTDSGTGAVTATGRFEAPVNDNVSATRFFRIVSP